MSMTASKVCRCENVRCPHGEDWCPNGVDQDMHELVYLPGDPVCSACVEQMRRNAPEYVRSK